MCQGSALSSRPLYNASAASDPTALNIGFQKFQQTGAWSVWIDEVAFDDQRIGCDG